MTAQPPASTFQSAARRPLSDHLRRLEAESIEIIREVAAAFDNPVMLYSIGKDSGVMLHLAVKAFYPSKPPFPLLHVDTTWKFKDMIRHRDSIVERYGVDLKVYVNQDGVDRGIGPIASGSSLHTQVMKTEALKQALDLYGFDAAFGGARRDEEKSRAKERIFSFRSEGHTWDPRNQRPELWRLYNTRISQGETIREFGRYEGLETGPDIRAITEDPAGNIWATVMNIGIFRQRGDRFELFTADHLPRALDYRALHFDADGTLWVATYGDGLYQVAGGRVRHWTVRDGLPSNYLVALVEDREGTLWLGSVNGIIGLAGRALNEYVPGKSLPLLGRQLTVTEGLDSQICSGWGQPVAVCGPDGRLCFPNQRALAVFDPAAVHPSPLALPVSLEEVRMDGASVPLDGGSVVRVRSGARHIEFQYALPDLHSLARVRFRYRLRGLDDEWTTTQQGVAGYNFLSPGRYEFQVMASGPDGRWHGSVAPAGLVVEPRLWERTSVRITAAAVLAGLVVAAVWMVSRARMQRRLLRMEALQAAEQERRRIARDLHDELGSGLTEIMQLGDLGCEEGIVTDDLRGNARTIAQKTRRLAAALDEIVWTTNPGNDSLPKFSGYLCDYAQEFMRATPVRCRLDTVSLPDDILLQAAVRHNLLLACKEALRNAVRHSGAGEVWLRLRYEAGRFQIVIEDNGRGFTPDSLSGRGNGVRNMRERVELVGGQMKLASEPGKGCMLTFELPFPAAE